MAKKKAAKDLNKAQTIREFAAANPGIGPTEIAKTLSEKHGVTFAPSQVSNTLGAKKKKKAGRGRATAGVKNGNNIAEVITLARQFVAAAGGTGEAAEVLLALGDEVGNG